MKKDEKVKITIVSLALLFFFTLMGNKKNEVNRVLPYEVRRQENTSCYSFPCLLDRRRSNALGPEGVTIVPEAIQVKDGYFTVHILRERIGKSDKFRYLIREKGTGIIRYVDAGIVQAIRARGHHIVFRDS